MSTAASIVITSLLACWFLASILVQFRPRRLTARRNSVFDRIVTLIDSVDVFDLVPRWTFYAPTPLTAEYLLLVRYFDDAERLVLDWVHIYGGYRWRLTHALFNPSKFSEKAFIDYVHTILRQAEDADSYEQLQLTLPYMLFLGICVKRAPKNARLLQFMIARREADIRKRSWSVAMISNPHEVA